MHKLIQRQIKRKLRGETIPANYDGFFDVVSRAYVDFEKERDLLERTLSLVSEELNQSNEDLRHKLAQLEGAYVQLSESTAVLDGILDATGEAIVAIDSSGKVVLQNQTAGDLFPFLVDHTASSEFKVIRNMYRLLKSPGSLARQLRKVKQNSQAKLYGTLDFSVGKLVEFHSSPQMSEGRLVGRVWCFREVTKIKENEALVEHLAFHDALTHLPNRILFLDRLNHAIENSSQNESLLAVLFIDLDHFKKVNDTAGHQCGDKLLMEVARRIRECLREQDTLARFGGDEFVVLLENIKSFRVASMISQRILEIMTVPFEIEEKVFHISSSIGVTLYPKDDVDPEGLIRKADLAMYQAKNAGRSHFEFFNVALERLAHFQLDLENKIRQAVEHKSFEIYFQPQVDTENFRVHSMEALIRWIPEGGKPISPAEFIPLAEKIGLIGEIDRWVMANVCLQVRRWLDMQLDNFRVSINLSAVQLTNERLIEDIEKLFKKYNITGKYIEFEITESMLMANMDKAIEILHKVRLLDIVVAIDDFGTGYSSLQYLQKLPIDTIKIDRSFIFEYEQNTDNKALVNTIIDLGKNLNLKLVAEGVEEKSSVDYLCEKKCDYIQGYYFYKPLQLDDITKVLLAQLQDDGRT